MTFPCAVEPDERSEPVAHLKPAASKLGAPDPPPPVPDVADPGELAAEVAALVAGAEDAALVAAAEVVAGGLVLLLLEPQAERVTAPAATSATSAVSLVFFTRFLSDSYCRCWFPRGRRDRSFSRERTTTPHGR
jgi:hypothetical protein